ncbi:MAG: GDYXXLXY domain-containing protein [Psychrobacter sp.]|nr:GDYXXLXY domain-containing protein [Psychrobacter sp.]
MSHLDDNVGAQKPIITSRPWWQKRTFKISIALLGLLLVITMMTINVAKYETHLANGDTVLLELAPVDPRGFMQGDYMTLRYAIADDILTASEQRRTEVESSNGYAIIQLDKNNVGYFVRLVDSNNGNNLATNELPIYYRIRRNQVKLATNAFFFQEGHAEAFEAAKYGLFRVNNKGEPLLTDMVDERFGVIEGVSIQDENIVDESAKNTGRQDTGM